MSKMQNQPGEDNAVLGTHDRIPIDGVVLGGIERVKQQLTSEIEEHRVAALTGVLDCIDIGLGLVIQALQDSSEQVQKLAYKLLRDRKEPEVQQALAEFNPYRFFEPLRYFEPRYIEGKEYLGWLKNIVISTDGQTVAASNRDDNDINVWNFHTGELLRTLDTKYQLSSIMISSDGQTIAGSSGDRNIHVWSLHTGILIRTYRRYPESADLVLMSPNLQIIAICSDSQIKVQELHTEKLLYTFYFGIYRGCSIAISHDGQTIACARYLSSGKAEIEMRDLLTGELLFTLIGTCSYSSDNISSHGKIVITCNDVTLFACYKANQILTVWNCHTEKAICNLSAYSRYGAIAISPNGQTIISPGGVFGEKTHSLYTSKYSNSPFPLGDFFHPNRIAVSGVKY
jgi:WD40 repeat protein